MDKPVSQVVQCQVIGEFQLDASGYVPRPRGEVTDTPPLGPPGSRAGGRPAAAKARWLAVIKENMVPGDGGRHRIAEERGLTGDRLEVYYTEAGPPSSAAGQEVRVESADHLALYHSQAPGESEAVSYIPWEAIVRITFCRRRPST